MSDIYIKGIFRAYKEKSAEKVRPVLPNTYEAIFCSWKVEKKLLPYIDLTFQITNTEFIGRFAGYCVRPEMEIKATGSNDMPTLFSVCSALIGREIKDGEFVDLNDLIGLPCQLIVGDDRAYEGKALISQVIASKKE